MNVPNKRIQKHTSAPKTNLKILITGDPGAGKSTTAKIIAQHFNIPVFHADAFRLKDPSTFNPYKDFKKNIQKILAENKSYIIDGCNFGEDIELIKKITNDVDIILNFDFPTTLALSNWIKRTDDFMKGATHDGTTIGKGYTYGSPKDFKFFLEYYASFIEEREKRKDVFEKSLKILNLRNFYDLDELIVKIRKYQNTDECLLNLLASVGS